MDYIQEYIDNNGVYQGPAIWEGSLSYAVISQTLRSLGTLKTVIGTLRITEAPLLVDLGDLRFVRGSFSLGPAKQLLSLNNLKAVGGSLDISHTGIKSVDNLHFVGSNFNCALSSLENWGDLIVRGTVTVDNLALLPPSEVIFGEVLKIKGFLSRSSYESEYTMANVSYRKHCAFLKKIEEASLSNLILLKTTLPDGYAATIARKLKGTA